jgi:hypothetical protein
MIHANLNHICHKAESIQDGRSCHTSGKHDHLLVLLHQTLTKQMNSHINRKRIKKNEMQKGKNKENIFDKL